ncbi:GyrI-like domain-containing protein [Crocinitomix catalasitica]|uniref:GyrI-like domain-containing protein n=1 Tax=Crocinitomix catalasitica TaxID=184607 RepID=UPI0004852B8F|nr:GyrI-like domain-containing protein [Crocinitomix catalasitica]
MKHEWRKKEKAIYLPKAQPEIIDIPAFKFITIEGEGNPNDPAFGDYIGALYPVAYAIKMTLKKLEFKPEGYNDYTVYPLEGVWDINDEAKKNFSGTLNKDDLVFKLMIRQPNFITESFFQEMHDLAINKSDNLLVKQVKFETITEGQCIQMLHIGSYDNESETFALMEDYAARQGVKRKSKIHREIYLSDFRKVAQDKLKTVLRFELED